MIHLLVSWCCDCTTFLHCCLPNTTLGTTTKPTDKPTGNSSFDPTAILAFDIRDIIYLEGKTRELRCES